MTTIAAPSHLLHDTPSVMTRVMPQTMPLVGAPSAGMRSHTHSVDQQRLRRAKHAYTTRHLASHLDLADDLQLVCGTTVAPRAGDVVLARVVQIGQHTRLESPESRRQMLFVGDEIVVAYAHRYAPDQFEAEVPENLQVTNLVAAGGLAGRVTARHAQVKEATVIEPLGLVASSGRVLNLADLAPHQVAAAEAPSANRPRLVVILGTSMNSGKSTTLACLIRGLTAAGLTVAAGKATGTGAGGDPRMFTDAGAELVLDFTDFGHGSTYRLGHDEVKALTLSMMDALSRAGTDVVVVEIADGIYQGETSRLVGDPDVQAWLDSVIFAAGDALGAVKGVELLQSLGAPVSTVSGVVTASPLASREATEVLPVDLVPTFDLTQAAVAREVLGRGRQR